MAGADDIERLVLRAAAGDDAAWETLVARFERALRKVARGYRLGPQDVDDVVQTTWLQVVSTIHRLREPRAFPGYVLRIARRAAFRAHQGAILELLTDRVPDAIDEATPEAVALEGDARRVLHSAIHRLPERQRLLIGARLAVPSADYRQLATIVAMPVGSIGPTQLRAHASLRRDRSLVELCLDR